MFPRCWLLSSRSGRSGIGRGGGSASRLEEFRCYVNNDADGFAAAAIQLLDVCRLEEFQISLAKAGIELFAGFGIIQSHLCQDDDAAQHFFEAANGPFREAFSINDHAQEITFGLSADRDPLQLAEQGSELRGTEAARRMLREVA